MPALFSLQWNLCVFSKVDNKKTTKTAAIEKQIKTWHKKKRNTDEKKKKRNSNFLKRGAFLYSRSPAIPKKVTPFLKGLDINGSLEGTSVLFCL